MDTTQLEQMVRDALNNIQNNEQTETTEQQPEEVPQTENTEVQSGQEADGHVESTETSESEVEDANTQKADENVNDEQIVEESPESDTTGREVALPDNVITTDNLDVIVQAIVEKLQSSTASESENATDADNPTEVAESEETTEDTPQDVENNDENTEDSNPDHLNRGEHLPLADTLERIREELYSEDASISAEQEALLEFMLFNYSQLENNLKKLMDEKSK